MAIVLVALEAAKEENANGCKLGRARDPVVGIVSFRGLDQRERTESFGKPPRGAGNGRRLLVGGTQFLYGPNLSRSLRQT